MRQLAKWLGSGALALLLIAAPGAALANTWRGAPAPHPGPGYAAPGWHGGPSVQPRSYGPYGPGYVPRAYPYAPPAAHYGYGARGWAPGYWGYHGGVRVWIGGGWAAQPQPGWTWISPNWTWTGYGWVWQNGYWSPGY